MRSLTTGLLIALAVLVVGASSSWAGVPCVSTTEVWAEKESTAVCEWIEIYIILRDCYGQPLANRTITFYTDIDGDVEYSGNPTITDINGFAQAEIHLPYPDPYRDLEDEYFTYLYANCQGVALGGVFGITFMNVAWLTTPVWDIALTSYGYSDELIAYKPHWRRAYPYNYVWREHDKLSGEWAAAIYYTGIDTPPIEQGPNVGQPQCMWLEPNFVHPDWVTNSGFWVKTPISTWNRGELPPPYLDTGMSEITNGIVEVRIDYLIFDDVTAMGRHSAAGNSPFNTFIWSDRYILQQTYTVTNVSGGTIYNVELAQFLHGHPAGGDETGQFEGWEVYDPTLWTTLPPDNFNFYQYDITQAGREITTWPWSDPYFPWCNWDWIGFHAYEPPAEYRAPWGWGLGPYRGHAPGKPARPGVHWDVEDDNLNGWGPNVVYPAVGAGNPVMSVLGDQVAGAMTWYLSPQMNHMDMVWHDVLLTIANRPYGGWHWGCDWWFFNDTNWPTWEYPSKCYDGYTWWLDFPYWWFCHGGLPTDQIQFGVSIPDAAIGAGVTVDGVYFKEYAEGCGGGATQATFAPNASVSTDLETNYPWPNCTWYGFSLDGYVLPDSQMVVYVELGDATMAMESEYVHAMMGTATTGWGCNHYDSMLVTCAGVWNEWDERATFRLAQNYPNPFRLTTEIRYALPEAAHVSLTVYNIAGQLVKTLVDEHQAPGVKIEHWDGTNERGMEVTGGIYFCKFTAGEYTDIKKMVLAR